MDRLFYKYLAPFLAISIIPTLAIVLILFFFIRNNITELEQNLIQHDTETLTALVAEKNEAIARNEGMYIEHEIEKVRERLKAMQLDPDFVKLDIENINASSENFFAQEPSIMELSVVNSFGDRVYQKFNSSSLESDEPDNISEEAIFKQVEKKIRYTSPVEISTATNIPYVMLGEPILGSTRVFTGAILVKLDLDFIREMVSSTRIGKNGVLFIVSSDGTLIAHPSLREFYQNSEYTKYDYVTELLAKKNGTVTSDESLVSFYTNKYGWTTAVEIPTSEALLSVEQGKRTILSFVNATLQSIGYFTVLIILFGFIIATVTSVFITRRMISPIMNFTNATHRIAQGEFPMKIEKQSNDELGELTDSFNKMAEELKKEREYLLNTNEQVRAEAKEAVSKLVAAQGSAPNFNMSDFERPLMRVRNYLKEIKKDVGNSKARQTNEVIEDIEQIDAFLKDLFEHSKITVNIADFAPVDFFDTFKTALDKLQKDVKQSNANIKCGHLPTTKALRSSITQLFENLLSNAIKYRSERSPEIVVASEDKGTHWQFSVKDNGCGIERGELENIFRVRENQTNGQFKFNFGLALCKNIVERHGGNIWVESKPGIGSTFYFTIMKY